MPAWPLQPYKSGQCWREGSARFALSPLWEAGRVYWSATLATQCIYSICRLIASATAAQRHRHNVACMVFIGVAVQRSTAYSGSLAPDLPWQNVRGSQLLSAARDSPVTRPRLAGAGAPPATSHWLIQRRCSTVPAASSRLQ